MWFKILYSIFLFCVIFLTAPLGTSSLSPRQIVSVIMLAVCFFYDKKLYGDKYWMVYLVFIAFFGLSSLATSYFNVYLLRLIGDFFVAFVACWASKLLIEKNNGLHIVITCFIIFGLIDSIITIGQVMRWPFADLIPAYFNLNLYDTYNQGVEIDANLMEYAIPGFFRNAVDNGHFLLTATVVSTALFEKKNKLVAIICTTTLLTGSFMVQQRSGFYLAILFSVYSIWKNIIKRQKTEKYILAFVFIIVAGLLFTYFNSIISSTESRVSQLSLDSTGRVLIWKICIEYIGNHPLLGGFFSFINENHIYPHNVVLSAFISGGIIGGSFLIIMIYMQITSIIKDDRKKKTFDFKIFVVSISYLAVLCDSFFHNISFANGDVIIWVIWTSYYYGKTSVVNYKYGVEGNKLVLHV